MTTKICDYPKIESPFVRKIIDGNYVVTNEIPDDMRWVFEDEIVWAEEKLNGSNTSIVIENGTITSIWNRTERLPFFNKGKSHYIQGVLAAFEKGYCELPDGQFFGELIGEKIAKNPMQIKGHLWVPFNTYLREHCSYKSWHKYPKTFDNIQDWFLKPISEGGIFSLFAKKRGLDIKPEGIVFHHPDGRLAKLRLDMMPRYSGDRHKGNAEAKPEEE